MGPALFRLQGEGSSDGWRNRRRGRKTQARGSQEHSNRAERVWGRPGQAEGLPRCQLWGGQVKSTRGPWLAWAQGPSLLTHYKGLVA